MDPEAPLLIGGVLPPGQDDLVYQLGNAQHVLIGLRRQTQHKIELHAAPPPGEGLGAGGEDLFFCQVLVDHVPQPLGPRFRGKGQAALSDGLELFHQLPGEVVCPERGHRQAHVAGGTVRDQLVRQLLQPPIVRGREAGQRQLVEACGLHELCCLAVKDLWALFTHRAAAKARLAEPAATDTATEHLQVGPVVDDFR